MTELVECVPARERDFSVSGVNPLTQNRDPPVGGVPIGTDRDWTPG